MKTLNANENLSDNLGHNILRIFYVLPNFFFTASEISFQNEKFINTTKKLLKN